MVYPIPDIDSTINVHVSTQHVNNHTILIGYYTDDCTIPEYIWTSAQMTTIL